jgi:hypothetical protein
MQGLVMGILLHARKMMGDTEAIMTKEAVQHMGLIMKTVLLHTRKVVQVSIAMEDLEERLIMTDVLGMKSAGQ